MTKLLEEAIKKVQQLPESEQERIAQVMLKEFESLTSLPKPKGVRGEKLNTYRDAISSEDSQLKLSEVLLLPELDDNEVLFERNNDTGRDVIL